MRALRITLLVFLLVEAGCASFQRRLIYFPPVFDSATADRLGAEAGLVRWDDTNGTAIGWKQLARNHPALGQLLIIHGNAGAAIQCAHYADVIQQIAAMDVFILEYPGYADRSGKPSETALEKSASEALGLLATNQPVYVVGESLGTGLAAWVAGHSPDLVAGVVLLAPYDSLTAVAGDHYPFLLPWLTLVDRFPAEKFLKRYQGPVAVVVGGKDEVIPMKFGRRLYDSYAGPKRLWELPDADHGGVMLAPTETWREVFEFLGSHPNQANWK